MANKKDQPLDPPEEPEMPPVPDSKMPEEREDFEEYHFFSIQNLRIIGISLAIAAGAIAAISVVLFLAFQVFNSEGNQPLEEVQVAPSLAEKTTQLKATEQAQLEKYGWYNQEAGVAQIPIDRAMEIVAQRGTGQVAAALPIGVAPAQASGAAGGSGEALFQQLGCPACHQQENTQVAPTLHGIFGKEVELEGGGTVMVDEAYIHESILNPTAKVVAGYQPIMPSYDGRVTEEQLATLVEYIKSLSAQ